MAKVLENTTISDIEIKETGVVIPASSTYTISPNEYPRWAESDVITEITPHISSGDVVVNDGSNNLASAEGLNFIKYPDTASNIRLLSKTETSNDYTARDLQEGMEEIDFRSETLEPTGFDNLTDSEILFDELTRTATIQPSGASYDYYIHGQKFTKTAAETFIIPDSHGIHIVYMDNVGSGQFVGYTGAGADKPYDGNEIKICVIYWDATNKKAILSLDARALLSMPWAIQRRSHFTARVEFGTNDFVLQNYTNEGDGSLDSHAQFGLESGSVFHEDAKFDVIHSATPSAHFEQDIESIAKIPIYYRLGTGNQWFKKDATSFPLYEDAGNTIFYNPDPGGVFELANCPNNSFTVVYYFATINISEPIIGVLGHHAENNPSAVVDKHMISPAGLPVPAMGFIKAVVFHTSTALTNTPHARIFAVTDVQDNLSNDRYVVTAEYTGNANTGRWLQISQGEASDTQPILIPENSFIRTVTVQSTAAIDAGKKIGFFEVGDLVTPRFEVTIATGGLMSHTFDVTEFFSEGEHIAVQVTNGAISKPIVRFWIQTSQV